MRIRPASGGKKILFSLSSPVGWDLVGLTEEISAGQPSQVFWRSRLKIRPVALMQLTQPGRGP
jgi:hypothetical protein